MRAYVLAVVLFAALLLLPSSAQAQTAPTSEQCASAWRGADQTGTLAAYQNFLRFFSTCAEADVARDRLSRWQADDGRRGSSRGVDRGGAQSAPAIGGAVAYEPVGRLIVRGEGFLGVQGGYGVVLMRRTSAHNNHAACTAFTAALAFTSDPVSTQPQWVDGAWVYHRPVYWPLLTASPSRAPDCGALLAAYDYDRADVLMRRIPNASRGDGPFLVMMASNGARAGVFDFSNVPEDELDDQFRVFLEHMSQQPDLWTRDFYQEASLRQLIRSWAFRNAEPANLVIATLFDLPTTASASNR